MEKYIEKNLSKEVSLSLCELGIEMPSNGVEMEKYIEKKLSKEVSLFWDVMSLCFFLCCSVPLIIKNVW